MRETRAAGRYAKSLLNLATERNELERVYDDMENVRSAIRNNKDLELLLKSPIIKTDKKKSILKMIFGGESSEMVMDFILIITSKGREYYLEGIADSLIRQYKKQKNIVTVEVTSAIPLDDSMRDKIISIVKESNNSDKIDLIEKVDPDIIGGYVLRVGDIQLDASVENQLQDLKKQFSKNIYIKEI